MEKILICAPGRSFSGTFLISWTNMIFHSMKCGYQLIFSQQYDPNVYYVRNKCLGGDVLRGMNQKPFDGKIDYDYLVWIDSDIVFAPELFQKLIDDVKKYDVVSGLYFMQGRQQFAVVKDWDEEFFKKNGYFKFLTPVDIQGVSEPFEVSYSGLGFMAMKRSAIELLEYPWFSPITHQIGNATDFSSEDVSFCLKLREKGIKIYVDPLIIVGHEKTVVL